MKTTTTRQRLTIALIGAATIIGASACGTAGTGTSPSAPPSTKAGSAGASMDSGMSMSASSASSTPSTTGARTGASSGSTGTPAEMTIHIKSFAYTGAGSVPAGSSVTVMNMDNEAHTVTADDGSFDAVVKAGTSTTFTAPAKPGTYTYHCTYHSNMHGSLTVK